MRPFLYICVTLLIGTCANATTMDETEVSIGEFSESVAFSCLITHSEQRGGMVYEAGWVFSPDWNWRAPYGTIGPFNEPVVHVTYSVAEQYCKWKGKRLTTKEEWARVRYTEKRIDTTDGYTQGETYPFPKGEKPIGANCLSDCDAETLLVDKKINLSGVLNRGLSHASVGVSKRGAG